jgi:hypothetical protein
LPSNQPHVLAASLYGPNSPSDIPLLHSKITVSGSDFHPTTKPVPKSHTFITNNNLIKSVINLSSRRDYCHLTKDVELPPSGYSMQYIYMYVPMALFVIFHAKAV